MTDFIEYSIKIKDESKTLVEKDFCYDSLFLHKENADLKRKVEEMIKKFDITDYDPTKLSDLSIEVRAKLVWQ